MIGDDLDMTHPAEAERGVYLPVQIYPMFETAIRAAAGRDPDEHLGSVSELWARFSAVAAANPSAWFRDARSAEEIRTTVAPRTAWSALPYRKCMNSNNDVDMAAAVIMCSVETAERLGRRRATAGCSRTPAPTATSTPTCPTATRSPGHPAIELGGRRALELAGVGIDDVAIVDLYSCFPSAVQLGARSLGLGDRPSAHPHRRAVVRRRAVEQLRDARHRHRRRATSASSRASTGLVWANGGYATKHAFGVYGTDPPDGGFRHDDPQAEIDALPQPAAGGRRRGRRPGDDRGLHRHARPRRRARAGDRHVPARRRPPGLGPVGRRRRDDRARRRRVGRPPCTLDAEGALRL